MDIFALIAENTLGTEDRIDRDIKVYKLIYDNTFRHTYVWYFYALPYNFKPPPPLFLIKEREFFYGFYCKFEEKDLIQS